MIPTSKSTFKEFCFRKLGKGMIKIDITDDQADDRIDEALSFFADYHFDGNEKIYYKHILEQADITNEYILLPENIIGVVRIFDIGGFSSIQTDNIFSIQYQYALNDMFSITSRSIIPFFMARMNLSLLDELLIGKQPIRYNRHNNKLYIDMNWSHVHAGQYVIVEAYNVIDPDVYTDVWKDRWLQEYTVALMKMQWGMNLKKFENMAMPGNLMFSGQKIYDEGEAEYIKLRGEMISSYSPPVGDFVG